MGRARGRRGIWPLRVLLLRGPWLLWLGAATGYSPHVSLEAEVARGGRRPPSLPAELPPGTAHGLPASITVSHGEYLHAGYQGYNVLIEKGTC
jgi:hypothetical protein